jgi:hypothetical protein
MSTAWAKQKSKLCSGAVRQVRRVRVEVRHRHMLDREVEKQSHRSVEPSVRPVGLRPSEGVREFPVQTLLQQEAVRVIEIAQRRDTIEAQPPGQDPACTPRHGGAGRPYDGGEIAGNDQFPANGVSLWGAGAFCRLSGASVPIVEARFGMMIQVRPRSRAPCF